MTSTTVSIPLGFSYGEYTVGICLMTGFYLLFKAVEKKPITFSIHWGFYIILVGLGAIFIPGLNQAHQPISFKNMQGRGLVAFWDFAEAQGVPKRSTGKAIVELKEYGTPISVVNDGPLSGQSILLDGSNYLSLPYAETGELNLTNNQVTVMAWVKWTGEQIGFVGGMWNEYQDGGKRQYGLFVSLPHYNGANQVCGHISKNGGPTPPFPFSIDYSASKQTVSPNEWCCVAFTYDGAWIRSYLNGKFEPREPELIDHTKGYKGYPDGLVQSKNPYHYPDGMGNNGSDFTVGAVMLKKGMGNFFKGQIGGLAVFDRALSSAEIAHLSRLPDVENRPSSKTQHLE